MNNITEIGTSNRSNAILANSAYCISLDAMFSVIGSRGPRGD